jgi:hypothetical protein
MAPDPTVADPDTPDDRPADTGSAADPRADPEADPGLLRQSACAP